MALTPLATSAQFNLTPFQDLAKNLQAGELDNTMLRATRACESQCRRRLAPFTGLVETLRLVDGDVEDPIAVAIPLPGQAQINIDYSRALGYSSLMRHAWVREFPPLYQDLWTGSVSSVDIFWSYQSTAYTVPTTSLQYEADTGHIRFALGTFVPPGSTGKITYSGGYSTIPDDLVHACITMAASIIIKELDPRANASQHDPDLLRDEAVEFLDPYMRD